MRRERTEKKKVSRRVTLPKILPLDARDPDIVRAEELIEKQTPLRRRAA